MSTLAALLRCLSRSDITEVRLQSDSAAAAALAAGGSTPLTKAPMSTAQISQIVDGTSIAGVLASLADGADLQAEMHLAEIRYRVRLMRAQGRIQIRFARHRSAGHDSSLPQAGGTGDAPSVAAQSVHAALADPPKTSTSATLRVTPEDADARNAARQLLCAILATARAQMASDVHLIADRPLRIRKHGELLAEGAPMAAAQVQQMLYSILSAEQIQAVQKNGYADLALDLPQVGRLRVNISRQSSGLKGCFRLVSSTVPTLAMLGLPKELEAVTTYHQGLAVISGPNGQGKTTTLAAIVNLINSATPHHIITVEDPVEVVHPVKRAVMSQREVGTHTKSFTRALKASLREDPDVIVIGELRDRETVEIALQAAETGHLVIATMSTRSAAKTIDRLIDLFPPDDQPQVRATLAGALKIIVSQRLVPGINGGMIAAAELITGSVPLWSLIRDNKLFQLPSLQTRGRSLGMIKFDTSLQELVQARKITLDVAKRYAENVAELERSLSTAASASAPAKGA